MKKLQGLTKKHIHSAIENKKLSSDDELHQLGAVRTADFSKEISKKEEQ